MELSLSLALTATRRRARGVLPIFNFLPLGSSGMLTSDGRPFLVQEPVSFNFFTVESEGVLTSDGTPLIAQET
jgi:hypothetical protein